jgi:hypothetical protein
MRFLRGVQILLLVLVLAPLPGCFLFFVLGHETVNDLTDQVDLIFSAMRARATTSICLVDDFFGNSCTYIVNGQPVVSSTTLVSEIGLFGVIIDPIVLELPAQVTNITGR